jgi:hypothetical protein
MQRDISVANPHHFDEDPDPDPACHFDADPDPHPACHLDADPEPTFHVDANPCGSGSQTLQNIAYFIDD